MILDRMLLRLLGRMLLITLGVLTVLGLVMDFFESARYFFSVKGTASDVLMFYVYKVPFLLHLLLPISLVVSTCIVFTGLGRGLELRAIAAAGIGPVRMSAPVLLVASSVVVATVLFGEFLVPPALDRTETLMVERFGCIDYTWRFYSPHHWYRGQGNRIFQVGHRTKDGRKLKAVTLLEMDPDFHIRRRTEFKRVVQEGGCWVGRRIEEYEFDGGKMSSLRKAKRKVLDWPEGPERFRDLRGRPKQKPLGELVWTIDEMERRGLPATKYRLELHNRFAFPLLGLGLVLLVFPWLSLPSRRRTLAGALIQAIGLIFGAYFLVAIATSAASGGLISPPVGAWLPPAIVSVAAVPKWVMLVRDWLFRRAG